MSDADRALFLREADVEALLTMDEAIEAVEAAFRALGEGRAENRPRARATVPGGVLNVMCAALPEAGVLGLKSYTGFRGGVRFLVLLYSAEDGRLLAVMEADRLGPERPRARRGGAPRPRAPAGAPPRGADRRGGRAPCPP